MQKFLFALLGGLLAAQLSLTTAAFASEPTVEGEVKKINESAGKITIQHGPIKNLDMGEMTMVFRVKEPDMLTKVKPGDKIKFEADRVNGAITVTEIKVTN